MTPVRRRPFCAAETTGGALAAIPLATFAVIEMLLALHRPTASILDRDVAKLGGYFFNPISPIIVVFGMGPAFPTANASVSA